MACAVRSEPRAVPPQPDGRGQRGRASQAPGHGAGSRRRGDERKARFRTLGADLLRRVRWSPEEADSREGHRGVRRGKTRPYFFTAAISWSRIVAEGPLLAERNLLRNSRNVLDSGPMLESVSRPEVRIDEPIFRDVENLRLAERM